MHRYKLAKLWTCVAVYLLAVTPARGDIGDQLVAHWKFDDGLTIPTTTVVSDSVAGLDGLFNGTNAWIAGQFDGALHFDGAHSADLPAFDVNSNQLTLSTWVRFHNFGGTFEGLFDSAEDAFVMYWDDSNSELRFKITDIDNDAARPGIPAASLTLNTWYNVTGVYDGPNNQARIYLDGLLIDTHTGADGTGNLISSNLLMGQDPIFGLAPPAGHLSGDLDDTAIWRRVLTAAEISSLAETSLASLLVPEPSSLGLAIVGMWALGSNRLRRRRRDRA